MKINNNLLDLLGKEVYAVFKQQQTDDIIVLGKATIKSIAFTSKGVALRTSDGQTILDEDICMDLEQVKTRINFLEKTVPLIKLENKIIKP